MSKNYNESEVKRKVKTAFDHAAPNEIESIKADVASGRGNAVSFSPRKKKKRKNTVSRIISVAAALVLCTVGLLGANALRLDRMVDSRIALEVNPSLEIEINKNERVLSVTALNDEARTVIGNMDLKGSDLEVAVNALIGSMLKNGYISEIANSILISVDSGDEVRGKALQEKLSDEVSTLLNTDTFSGAVLSQTISENAEAKQLADTHDISLGKAQLITQMAKQNNAYSVDELSALSINQLNLLNASVDGVSSVGTASDRSYIGAENAKNAAAKYAGIPGTVDYAEIDLDYERGQMIYEVEFYYEGIEYDFAVDAKTGNVLYSNREYNGSNSAPAQTSAPQPTSDTFIGEEKALEIALKHANLGADDIAFSNVRLDRDDGRMIYEADFTTKDGFEYEYDIDAVSGEIYKHSRERDDDYRPAQTSSPAQTSAPTKTAAPAKTSAANQSAAVIDKDTALRKAYDKAGLSASDVYAVECELDRDDGRTVYEIEFKSDGIEYSCEVDAETGKIYDFEKEYDD